LHLYLDLHLFNEKTWSEREREREKEREREAAEYKAIDHGSSHLKVNYPI
jgi:hypothetical protein